MLIRGTSKCEWYDFGQTKTFASKVILMNMKVSQFGRANLTAGEHHYNFECVLPPSLPASFEAKLGSNCYEIEAKMRSPKAIDETCNVFFTVAQIKDLNIDTKMRNSIHVTKKSKFWRAFNDESENSTNRLGGWRVA